MNVIDKLAKEFEKILSSLGKSKKLILADIEKIDEKYKKLAQEEKKSLTENLNVLNEQMKYYESMLGKKEEDSCDEETSSEETDAPKTEAAKDEKVIDTLFPENNGSDETQDADESEEDKDEESVDEEWEETPEFEETPVKGEEPEEDEEDSSAINADEGWPETPMEWN